MPIKSRHRITPLALSAALGVSLALGVVGCSAGTPAESSAQTSSQSAEQDRSASSVVKTRMCISNKTPENIELKWFRMLGEDGKPLPADKQTALLGPEAFNCAISWTRPAKDGRIEERGWVTVNGEDVALHYYGSLIEFRVVGAEGVDRKELQNGVPESLQMVKTNTTPARANFLLTATAKYQPQTVGSVAALPVNIVVTYN